MAQDGHLLQVENTTITTDRLRTGAIGSNSLLSLSSLRPSGGRRSSLGTTTLPSCRRKHTKKLEAGTLVYPSI